MPFYPLYRATTEMYMLVSVLVSPLLCVLGWLLLGKIISKRLLSYAHWYIPAVIGSSLSAASVLLIAFLRYFAAHDYVLASAAYFLHDYVLASAAYFLVVAGVPFHIVSFVRLWKTITALPPSSGEPPQWNNAQQDEGVWPPQPRR